jgi:signal transduction histidine kinase
MLRNLGIRWKVLTALALPVIVLAGAGAVITGSALDTTRSAQESQVVSDAGGDLATALEWIDAERLLSVEALRGDQFAQAELDQARSGTDNALNALNSALQWNGSGFPGMLPGSSDVLDTAQQDLREIGVAVRQARSDTDIRLSSVAATVEDQRVVLDSYTTAAMSAAMLPATVAGDLSDRSLANQLDSMAALTSASEAMSRMQLAGLTVIRGGTDRSLGQQDLAVASTDMAAAFDDFRSVANSTERQALTDLTASESASVVAGQTVILTVGPIDQAPDAVQWRESTTVAQQQLQRLGTLTSAESSAQAVSATDAAWQRVMIVAGTTVGVVILALLLAVWVSRRIGAPVRRLTDMTSTVADDLPSLMERAVIGEPVPDLVLAPRKGRDEVSRLAASIEQMYAATMRSAAQQDRLKSSVSETFITVARRNQVLLSRQLSFIDQLERTEEDPDILQELFRLDHLATRMRRNAESLLVLAGVDAGRRLRNSMPLSDVVRTAVSEIEHYERVAVRVTVDPPVASHLALPLAHLIAELVENATVFSEPGTRVTVTSEQSASWLRLSITDQGIGLTDEELAQANQLLSSAGQGELVGAQRLGFFVVSTLASRLGAHVQMHQREGGGTVVEIDLGPTIFLKEEAAGDADELAAPAPMPEQADPSVPQDIVPPMTEATTAAPPQDATGWPGQPQAEGQQPAWESPAEPAAPWAADMEDGSGYLPVREPAGEPEIPGVADTVDGGGTEAGPTEAAHGLPQRRRSGAAHRADQPGAPEPAPYTPAPPEPDQPAAYAPQAPMPEPQGMPAPTGMPEPQGMPAPTGMPGPQAPMPEPQGMPAPTGMPGPQAPMPEPQGMPAPTGMPTPAQPSSPPVQRQAPEEMPAPMTTGPMTRDVLPRHRGRGAFRISRRRDRPAAAAPPAPAPAPAWQPEQPPVAEHASSQIPTPGPVPAPRPIPEELAAPAPVGEAPAPAGEAPVEEEHLRHAITSEALSELSRLSSYSPTEVAPAPPSSLVRRTRPTESMPPEPEAASAQPPLDPTSVRSMLSGFQTGVRRGKTVPVGAADGPSQEWRTSE